MNGELLQMQSKSVAFINGAEEREFLFAGRRLRPEEAREVLKYSSEHSPV